MNGWGAGPGRGYRTAGQSVTARSRLSGKDDRRRIIREGGKWVGGRKGVRESNGQCLS